MPVEIDETELANYKSVASVLALIEKHPEARALAQKAVALAAPERAGPEIKIRGELDERFGKLESVVTSFIDEQKKDREERAAADAKSRLEREWMDGRRKLRDAGWQTDSIDQLEKFMEERGVADHEVAASHFEKLHPPPEPVMTGSNKFNWFDQPAEQTDLKPLLEGREDEFLGPAIANALKEVRGQR